MIETYIKSKNGPPKGKKLQEITEVHELLTGYTITPDYLPVGVIKVYRNGVLETDREYSGGEITFDDILDQEDITLIYSYQL